MRALGAQAAVSHQSSVLVQQQQSKEKDFGERLPKAPFETSTEGK